MRKFLTAEWRDLLMINYEVDPSVLKDRVPLGTELDLEDGRCYVSLVGFMFLKTRVLGFPIPFHRNFEEINLRFYVKRELPDETRRGVVFIKELVPRWGYRHCCTRPLTVSLTKLRRCGITTTRARCNIARSLQKTFLGRASIRSRRHAETGSDWQKTVRTKSL